MTQIDRNLWVLSIGWFVSAFGFAASLPFIAIYFHDRFGMNMTEIGGFFLMMAVVRSVFQLVGGEISDRVSRQSMLVWSVLVRSVAFGFIALSIQMDWGLWPVALGLLVNSMVGAIYWPVGNALVADILPEAKRLDGYAITRAAGNLGWAAGPAFGGFISTTSYAALFYISAVATFISSMIFLLWLKVPAAAKPMTRFRFSDLLSIKDDPLLTLHCSLIFVLYLVVAQLIVPFSYYSVEIAGISKTQLGYLYTVNGLLVALLQIPVTRLLAKTRLSSQLAIGAFIYAIGYASIGIFVGFDYFLIAIAVITVGEVFMSPPSLTITSRLAPPERMGRYMGIFGFFTMSAWSLGPLYGGLIINALPNRADVAWVLIGSLALVASVGFIRLGYKLRQSGDSDMGEKSAVIE